MLGLKIRKLSYLTLNKGNILKKNENIYFICLFVLGLILERHLYETKGFRHFDLSIFISCCVLTFLLCKKIYLKSYEYLSWFINKTDLCFVIICFVILCIPISHISKETKSIQENRNLATHPHFKTKTGLNLKYGEQFNSWLSDHFYGRLFVLKMRSIKNKFIKDEGIQNEKMFVGKDNWLFYKGDKSIRNFQNISSYTQNELENIARYLTDINDWCIKNNKKFYYFIAPDKHRIYGEFYKHFKKINLDNQNKTFQLIKYLKEHTNVVVIYPYQELLDQKEYSLLYYKNDTHWNLFGSYIGYQKLMKYVSTDFNIPPVQVYKWEMKKNPVGDLTNMYLGLNADNITEYKIPAILYTSSICSSLKKEKEDQICKNPNKTKKVFMLRDSFTSALQIYLNETFNSIDYKWRDQISLNDLTYIKNNADIIILEKVERGIPSLAKNSFPKENM